MIYFLTLALVDNRFAPCWATFMVGLRNRGSILIINVTLNYSKLSSQEKIRYVLNNPLKTLA